MAESGASLASEIEAARALLAAGDPGAAAGAGRRLLERYPSSAATWRLLGDAERARGDVPAAGRAYAAALARDPRCPDAWLGLALLAERRDQLDDALAFCQVAWEVAPERSDLRATLERLARLRHGEGVALDLSRPALATIHLRAGRFERAARELHAALEALPERVDLRLGLAEALWRMGRHDDAARACDAVLAVRPEAATALLILADIERRRGDGVTPGFLVERLAAVDPDGSLAAALERPPGRDS